MMDSLQSFKNRNRARKQNLADYLSYIATVTELPSDFCIGFGGMFNPDFLEVDGRIYVTDLYENDRHVQLIQAGENAASAQFWMNLIEITGMFSILGVEDAMAFAESLVACWNRKILADYPSSICRARAIRDEALGEVFVTIDVPLSG